MNCNTAGLHECFNPIAEINIPSSGLIFPYIEDSVLTQICSNYESVQSCVDASVRHCSVHEKVKISNKNDALKFLCTTGYQGYKKVRSCFEDETLIDKVKECNSTFTTGVNEIHLMENESLNNRKEHLCRCMKDLITCIKDSTRDICGEPASEWIYTMKTRMMSGTLSEIGCQGTQRDQLPTTLAICFAVLIAVVVIGLAFLIIYKKVRAEDENSKLTTGSCNRIVEKNTTRDKQSLEPLCHSSKGENSMKKKNNQEDVMFEQINENGSVILNSLDSNKADDSPKIEDCSTQLRTDLPDTNEKEKNCSTNHI